MDKPLFDDYLDLSDTEREALRRHVDAHPDLRGNLVAVEMIDRMVRAVEHIQDGGRSDESDEVLRYLLYTRMIQPDVPSPLRPLWAAMDARSAQDTAFTLRLERLRQAIEEAEPSVDALAQFERLSGHRLRDVDSARRDRAPRQNSRMGQRRIWQWAGAALIVLMGAYGALFTISYAQQSPTQQLASLGTDALGDAAVGATRGAVMPPLNEAVSTDELFRQATRMLRNSRSASFGLFPQYNPDSLSESIAALEAVISREDEGSFYIGQAYFVLGQAYLLLDDPDAARASLEAALSNGAHSATLAQQQLDQLSR
ncbi:MAG: tetratricopeptide repeat protein [Myxococcota bacterium]